MKKLHLILALVWLFGSCREPQKPFKQFELMALGTPEISDTLNRAKVGATRYYVITSDMDSVVMKSYDVICPITGDPDYPVKSNYQKIALPLEIKIELDSVISYLKPLPNGQLPGNKRPKDYYSCNLFGSWVGILTDASDVKHYYVFERYNLNPYLKGLCDSLHKHSYMRNSFPSRTDLSHINTDSLVQFCVNHHDLKIDISSILPPPLKSTVKFIPPVMEK